MSDAALILSIIIGIVIFFWFINQYDKYFEFKEFNNGICPFCKHKLEFLYMSDISNTRVYKCPRCGYKASVSYDFIDKAFIHKIFANNDDK